MQKFSEKVKTEYNEELGRHFVAAMDIEIGETLLNEQPLLITTDWECENMKCANCFEDSYIMCNKCNFFPLCMDCNTHDEFDCAFVQAQATSFPKQLLVRNYSIYGAFKLLLLLENPKTASLCTELLQLQQTPFDNIEMLQATEMWQAHDKLAVKPLLEANLNKYFKQLPQKLDTNFLHRLCMLIDAHAFEVNNTAGDTLQAVFVHGTRLPHHCVPNVVVSMDDQHQLKLYASVPIKQGDLLFNCYANPLMGTSQRQHHLRMTRFHDCACTRCLDPTELGTQLSSLKCQRCAKGHAHCDISGSGNWICEQCGASIPAAEAHKLMADLGMAMMQAEANLEQYEQLLNKYESKLHANHFLLLDIKQNIASILRAQMTSPLQAPSKQVLMRRVQISEQILPVIRAVTPGISKLYAINLFEYLLALLELAELQYKQGELPNDAFELKLQLAREIARKAMNMLAFEPTNSLEGHVRQRLEQEQKRILQHLDQLSTESI